MLILICFDFTHSTPCKVENLLRHNGIEKINEQKLRLCDQKPFSNQCHSRLKRFFYIPLNLIVCAIAGPGPEGWMNVLREKWKGDVIKMI